MATTAASRTAGWVWRTSSISFGLRFSPPRMMRSFFRPVIDKASFRRHPGEIAGVKEALGVEGVGIVGPSSA